MFVDLSKAFNLVDHDIKKKNFNSMMFKETI